MNYQLIDALRSAEERAREDLQGVFHAIVAEEGPAAIELSRISLYRALEDHPECRDRARVR